MGIGKAIGSAALGGLTGGVGGLVSGAIGGLGSLMGIGRRKEKKAREAKKGRIKDSWNTWDYKLSITRSKRDTPQILAKKCGTTQIMKIKKTPGSGGTESSTTIR